MKIVKESVFKSKTQGDVVGDAKKEGRYVQITDDIYAIMTAPAGMIVNSKTGKKVEVGAYALSDVVDAMRKLLN